MLSKHGFLWKLLNSWWIIPSFFLMACVGFFYIGNKARKRLWTIFGVLYLVVLAVLFYLDEQYKGTEALKNALVTYFFVGIIHSFYVRSEYLKIIDTNEGTIPPLSSEKEASSHSVMSETIEDPQKVHEAEQTKSNTVIDINTCKESDLVSLPGLTIVKAKRAIRYREEHNGFTSIDEFLDTIQLKPHFETQIRNMIVCKPIDNHTSSPNIGRKLDL